MLLGEIGGESPDAEWRGGLTIAALAIGTGAGSRSGRVRRLETLTDQRVAPGGLGAGSAGSRDGEDRRRLPRGHDHAALRLAEEEGIFCFVVEP